MQASYITFYIVSQSFGILVEESLYSVYIADVALFCDLDLLFLWISLVR